MDNLINNLKKFYKLDNNMSINANFIAQETHDLQEINKDTKKLKLVHDLFYELNFKVVKIDNNNTAHDLVINTHYTLEDIDLQASLKNEVNSKVYSSVKIIDQVDAKAYMIDYHVYGDKLKAEDYNTFVDIIKLLKISSSEQAETIIDIVEDLDVNTQNIEVLNNKVITNTADILGIKSDLSKHDDRITVNANNIKDLQDSLGTNKYLMVGEGFVIGSDLTSKFQEFVNIFPDAKVITILNPHKRLYNLFGRQVNVKHMEVIKKEEQGANEEESKVISYKFKEGSLLIDFEMKSEYIKSNSSTYELFHADYMRVKIYLKEFTIDFKSALRDGLPAIASNKRYASFYFGSNKTNNETLKLLENPLKYYHDISSAVMSKMDNNNTINEIQKDIPIGTTFVLTSGDYPGFELKSLDTPNLIHYKGRISGTLPEAVVVEA